MKRLEIKQQAKDKSLAFIFTYFSFWKFFIPYLLMAIMLKNCLKFQYFAKIKVKLYS